MQLFCFTYAGGTAAFFDFLKNHLDPSIEVEELEYAGHGVRHSEPFYSDFSELARDMYKHFLSLYKEGDEYALFGYSMGSISAVETLKLILKEGGIAPPVHVFLAAHEPYSRQELAGFSDVTIDEWIRERTIQFGGIPESLIHNKSFWRVYLPIYRADYRIIGKYDFQQSNFITEAPATVFYSETDTPYSRIKDWKHYFIGECGLIPFEGNHFFIYGHEQEIADMIMRKLGMEKVIRS